VGRQRPCWRYPQGDLFSDPRGALPAYGALLLTDACRLELAATLQVLDGRILIKNMRAANWLVDRDDDKQTAAQAAAWLEKRITAASASSTR
jgi:osmoprotectant transport system permease protein